jgi:streptogramin lyase
MSRGLRAAQAALLLPLLMQGVACTGEDAPNAGAEDPVVRPSAIAGAVQKGPFVRGTTVTVQELDDTLRPTGRSFEVATTDDLGGFTVPVHLSSRFIEVIATGYYYNELLDRLSPGPLTLRAVSDVLTEGKVNVNLLTSISAPLVRDGVARGQEFASARQEAESAVLGALGFTTRSRSSFDKLDVALPGDENAVLLAASLLIERYAETLGDSEVAQLTQLLSQIGAALSDGGGVAALAKLREARCTTAGSIDTAAVRRNLAAHYAAFGVTVAIPPFEEFVGAATNCEDASVADASVDVAMASEAAADVDVGMAVDSSPDTSATDASVDVSTASEAAADVDAGTAVDSSLGDAASGAVDAGVDGDGAVETNLDVRDAAIDVSPDVGAIGDAHGPLGLIEYPIPTSNAHPYIIDVGPDGNLWFTEQGADQIGRITPTGLVTEFPIPTAGSFPQQMTSGPDGNLWLTEAIADQIARVTPSGVFTEFKIPKGSTPNGITVGPDRNLWFGEIGTHAIGWMTTSGTFGQFPIPMASSSTQPFSITTGPDNNLWFVEGVANKIGRVTTAGVFKEYPIPSPSTDPVRIIRGPDGNLWFIEGIGNRIARITPSGEITEFPVALSGLNGLTSGSDGNLWVTSGGGPFARITPAGVVTTIDLGVSLSYSIIAGPDGRLWFTDFGANAIGAFSPT